MIATSKQISLLNKTANQIKNRVATSVVTLNPNAAFVALPDFILGGCPCFLAGPTNKIVAYYAEGKQFCIAFPKDAEHFTPLKELMQTTGRWLSTKQSHLVIS